MRGCKEFEKVASGAVSEWAFRGRAHRTPGGTCARPSEAKKTYIVLAIQTRLHRSE